MAARMIRSRRQFLKDSAGLLIGFSFADSKVLPVVFGLPPRDTGQTHASPPAARLDSWLRIEKDGGVRVFTGKADIGMGVETALIQIVAEELDVSPASVSFVMGDTARTVDQGGVGGSTSIMLGAKPLRHAAAAARLLLLQLAARRLGVPLARLEVEDGVVRVRGESGPRVAYEKLVADQELDEALRVSGSGFSLDVEAQGRLKDPARYTIVGRPVPRVDIPPKVLGRFKFVTDARVPGMLHGRVVRPPAVGAAVERVDEGSVKGIPGLVEVVVRSNFVGVVAATEWAAVRAARHLKVDWTKPASSFPEQSLLYQRMRTAPPKAGKVVMKRGDAAAFLEKAAQRIKATYEWPFQSHATMGPGCAVADVRSNGMTTIWSGAQKPHALRKGIADLLKVPLDAVRVIWMEDAGSYGRPGFADVAADAALLSQAAGKPVRVQWMRSDMTAWGAKGPAVICDMVAGLDNHGGVSAFAFASRAFSGGEIFYHPDSAGNFLAGQLIGIPNSTGVDEFAAFGLQSVSYGFPNLSAEAYVVPALYSGPSPLRTTHFRDPEGPAVTFAVESFMDEIAAQLGADPIEFRLAHLDDPRAKAVLQAVAGKAQWERRPSPKKPPAGAGVAAGRGVALAIRRGTYVATIAEVEVHRSSGEARVRGFTCAHDCGLIVNPDGLRGTIEANLIQSLSRSLKEEVTFDRDRVTSADWESYPVARSPDIPGRIEVVLLNHPELSPSGAGEPASRPTAAAIANAIFDATGARVRQAPLTPARIRAALTTVTEGRRS